MTDNHATSTNAGAVISFARGIPSAEMLPAELLAQAARDAIDRDGPSALNYGPPAGHPALRDHLAALHGTSRERVLVTAGSIVGLNLLVRYLLADGGSAVVEAPTYDRALHALADSGVDIATVDRREDGLDLAQLAAVAATPPKPKLLYVIPTFQNPSGANLTESQRRELAEIACEHDLLIVEDDPYRDLAFDGTSRSTVQAHLRRLGREDLSVFSSSFSKTVAPGLRVGYLILPEWLVGPMTASATRAYISPPILPQAQLLAFLDAGHLEPHLQRVRSALRQRCDAMLDALCASMPPHTSWTVPAGGYFVWLSFPTWLSAEDLNDCARDAGVTLVPGADFFAEDRGQHMARLAFSSACAGEITAGIRRLGTAARGLREGQAQASQG